MKNTHLHEAILIPLLLSTPVFADLSFEFGNGAEPLSAIDFQGGDLSENQQVAVDFFNDDAREITDFLCYESTLKSLGILGVDLGSGIDCLSISPVLSEPLTGDLGDEHATPETPAGLKALSPQIDAVTFFFIAGEYLVVDGNTTVRPIFDGVGDGLAGGAGPFGAITHITGSIPGNDSNIVAASGELQHLVGKSRVRLSGAVNTDEFFTSGDDHLMTFSCYFTIIE
jgi:hypothetical protein